MELKARIVLQDCRDALDELEGPYGNKWRRRWVAMLALLRTVGFVLDKVDGQKDKTLRTIIDEKWLESKPDIFKEFIEKDRNKIVHEYKFNAAVGVTINVPPPGGIGSVEHPQKITEGFYKGRDLKDLVNEAIQWWENYLSDIAKKYETVNNPNQQV